MMRCRPSDMLSLTGSIRRYFFDRAVWLFGSTLDSELEASAQNCKDDREMLRARQMVLNRWFPEQRKFLDPARR